MTMHRYRTALTWSGSTRTYEGYGRSGVDVLKYLDDAEGQMPESGSPMRVTRITPLPHVVVRGGDPERVERLLHKAHQQCYIANSLTSEVAIEPTIEVI
jgi:organic hydroperoxide reductase OsmC/OhrA